MDETRAVSAGELLLYRFKGRTLKLCVSLGIALSALALLPAALSTEDRGRRCAAIALLIVFWLIAEHQRSRSDWVPDVLADRRWVLAAAALTAVPYAIDGHAQSDAFMGLAPLAGVAATTCRRREVVAFTAISVLAYLVGVVIGGGGFGVFTTADHPFDGVQQVAAICACCGLFAVAVLGFRRFIEEIPAAVAEEGRPELPGTPDPRPTATSKEAADEGRGEKRPDLTDRELDVLALLADDKSRPEISEILLIAPGTVKSRIDSARAKIGVRDQAEAVAYWVDHHGGDG